MACIGRHTCDALQSNPTLCGIASDNIIRKHSICCLCYENLGGHIYRHPDREKSATTCVTEKLHANDATRGLECLGNWLINIAHTNNNSEFKEKLLIETFKTLFPFTSVLNSTDHFNTTT